MAKKEFMIRQLNNVFDGLVWYGPTIMQTLNQVSVEHGSNQYKDSHTVIELIAHMTAWRKFVIERLSGNETFEVTEESNFHSPRNLSAAIQKLKESQVELIKAIEQFPEENLSLKVPTREYTFQFMLNGIIQHDLYHLGQIGLLNR